MRSKRPACMCLPMKRMPAWPYSSRAMIFDRPNVTVGLVSFSVARCAASLPLSNSQESRRCKKCCTRDSPRGQSAGITARSWVIGGPWRKFKISRELSAFRSRERNKRAPRPKTWGLLCEIFAGSPEMLAACSGHEQGLCDFLVAP